MLFSFPKLKIAGQIAAFAAIMVALTGKTLHDHQECSGACAGQSTEHNSSAQVACPFGCEHHGNDPSDGDSAPTHDDRQCSVCQVLAQAPSMPMVIGLPHVSSVVASAPLAKSQEINIVRYDDVLSRGPPTAVRIFSA